METPTAELPPGQGVIQWEWPDSPKRPEPPRWESYEPPELTGPEEQAVERAVELLELRRSWDGTAIDFPHPTPEKALEAVTGPPERFGDRYYTLAREGLLSGQGRFRVAGEGGMRGPSFGPQIILTFVGNGFSVNMK